MVCKSSLFLSRLLHKNIKGKMRMYVTTVFTSQLYVVCMKQNKTYEIYCVLSILKQTVESKKN